MNYNTTTSTHTIAKLKEDFQSLLKGKFSSDALQSKFDTDLFFQLDTVSPVDEDAESFIANTLRRIEANEPVSEEDSAKLVETLLRLLRQLLGTINDPSQSDINTVHHFQNLLSALFTVTEKYARFDGLNGLFEIQDALNDRTIAKDSIKKQFIFWLSISHFQFNSRSPETITNKEVQQVTTVFHTQLFLYFESSDPNALNDVVLPSLKKVQKLLESVNQTHLKQVQSIDDALTLSDEKSDTDDSPTPL